MEPTEIKVDFVENSIVGFSKKAGENGTEQSRVGETEGESRGTKVTTGGKWMVREGEGKYRG